MFKLEPLNNEIEAKTLPLSDRLFHVALREAPESAARFHVKNDRGEDFDIVYWDNEDDIEPAESYPAYVKPPFIAKYPLLRRDGYRDPVPGVSAPVWYDDV